MKPGSVIVDLAAEAGGNCEATVPGMLVTYKDVTIIGSSSMCLLSGKATLIQIQATLIFLHDFLRNLLPFTVTTLPSFFSQFPPKINTLV